MEFVDIKLWHLGWLLLLPILYWTFGLVRTYLQWPLWMKRSLSHVPPVALPDGYRLRSFRPGDEEAWVRLVNTAFAMEKCVSVRMSCVAFRRRFSAKIRAGRIQLLFAEREADGELVGTTMMVPFVWKGPGTAAVVWMAVHPAHRGRGLGSVLLTSALHQLRERGYMQVVLTTNPALSSAVRLYQRLGFVPEHPRVARQMLRHTDVAGTTPCE